MQVCFCAGEAEMFAFDIANAEIAMILHSRCKHSCGGESNADGGPGIIENAEYIIGRNQECLE